MEASSHRRAIGGQSEGPRGGIVALIVIAGMLVGTALVSPVALLVVLRDGGAAAAIVLAATGLGLCIVRVLGMKECLTRWRLAAGAGLGLGALSLLVLGLGVVGIQQRRVWVGLLVAFLAAGLLQLRGLGRPSLGQSARGDDAWMRWLWLGVVAFGVMALLAGTMPPGTIWPAEGNGYDVLEYHLGVPREYFEAGRISYLPHNIYSNFPFNVEMLYLLAMILRGDPVEAALVANLLNVLLGVLAVAAVWLAGREFGRGSGIVAGLAAASCPFLTYLCGVAYVENGMLMFAALSLAAVLRAGRVAGNEATRWVVLAGLFCGLACGCKYTAIPAVLAPLTIAAVRLGLAGRPRPLTLPAAFVLAAVAAFGPWLAKNTIMTGNPVFPLAHGILGERSGIWNEDGAARWQEGHLPAPEDRPWFPRLRRLWAEVPGSRLFGPMLVLAVFVGGIGGLAKRRQGEGVSTQSSENEAGKGNAHLGACWLMLIVGLAVWVGWTHLVGRFAITLMIPAAVILGGAWERMSRSSTKTVGAIVLIGVVGMNTYSAYGLLAGPPVSYLQLSAFGRVDLMTDGKWPGMQHVPVLNAAVAKGEKVLMVADARRFYLDRGVDYCVVFNPNPFAEAAARLRTTEMLDWLRERRYTKVYVDWTEMRRLRTTRYGFWAGVDRELLDGLAAAGLGAVESFQMPERKMPYGTLFEVPGKAAGGVR